MDRFYIGVCICVGGLGGVVASAIVHFRKPEITWAFTLFKGGAAIAVLGYGLTLWSFYRQWFDGGGI